MENDIETGVIQGFNGTEFKLLYWGNPILYTILIPSMVT